ncbi:unnamed protein product [Rotaria socialis]|uniref:Uncharacterized protein n=1 Tax=Rotaria socialis TaxID=392032 RepID=A0A821GR61_9BILA|nr:unnamed protein product [Rotaria socialis]
MAENSMRDYEKSGNQPLCPLVLPFEIGKYKVTDIQLRNVTRLDLNPYFDRSHGKLLYCFKIKRKTDYSIEPKIAGAKLLAHLISMPIQLKDLRIYSLEWLLHIVQYAIKSYKAARFVDNLILRLSLRFIRLRNFAFDELRKDALNTVQYAEFKIPGCHRDSNELIRIGKNLVPFLSTYMAHLQTLCLWRPDDFPWTSIRPDYKRGYYYGGLIRRRYDKLQTPESIKKHVIIFEEDLCELVEQMKDLIFLDIHGEIHEEKVEPYRSVVQAIFPYNRSDIEMFRFRLWL